MIFQAVTGEKHTNVSNKKSTTSWKIWYMFRPSPSKLHPQNKNIDTKNDGLEMIGKCISFQTWLFWVSMLDFRGVCLVSNIFCGTGRSNFFTDDACWRSWSHFGGRSNDSQDDSTSHLMKTLLFFRLVGAFKPKNIIVEMGRLPQILGVKIKNVWNHHLADPQDSPSHPMKKLLRFPKLFMENLLRFHKILWKTLLRCPKCLLGGSSQLVHG